MFEIPSRRRPRTVNSSPPEQLEVRLLLTPDLEIVSMEPGFLQEVTRETNGDNTASLFTKMFRRNIGTTAVQLNSGTPDPNDDVVIKFFLSADTVLSPADALVGSVRLTATFAPNGGGEDVSQLAGEFTVKSIGNFIIAFIDANNIIAESNESNNLFVMDIRTPSVEITGVGGNNAGKKRVASVDPAIGFLDGNSANYNGGQIQASMTNAQAGEFLQIFRNGRGQDKIRAAGTQLKIGSRVVGTVTGNKTASLTIDFNADLDQVDVQRILRTIGYKVVTDSPGTRNFTFRMKDPTTGILSNLASKNVNINLV